MFRYTYLPQSLFILRIFWLYIFMNRCYKYEISDLKPYLYHDMYTHFFYLAFPGEVSHFFTVHPSRLGGKNIYQDYPSKAAED